MLNNNEKFKLEIERLDQQIAHKKSLQKILTREQYGKWRTFNKSKKRDGNKYMANTKRKNVMKEEI